MRPASKRKVILATNVAESSVTIDNITATDISVAGTGGGNNNTGFCDPRYDEMIQRQAPRAASREERYAIFHAAETRLMEQMPIIPIYTYTSNHLIHPSVQGMPSNLMDAVNFKYVALDKNWKAEE